MSTTGLMLSGAGFAGVSSPALITANAVDFDGTSDFLTKATDFSGNADAYTGMYSVWWRRDGAGTEDPFIQNEGGWMTIRFTSANKLDLQLFGGASSLTFLSTDTFSSDAAWHHLLAAWDCNAAAGAKVLQIYMDDVSLAGAVTDATAAFQVDYTRSSWGVAARYTSLVPFNGALAEMYFAPGQYLDISLAANRRKFASLTNKPVNLGSDGSAPTGTAPILYLKNAAATCNVNSGTGGDMTINGAPAVASTSPSD